jgi:hypothetical protein
MQGLRRQIHLATSALCQTSDELPGLQKAGSQTLVHLQLSEIRFDFRREESGLHRLEAGQ